MRNSVQEAMKLNRIQARCETSHEASARVLEKIGMKYEGTLRDQMFVKNRFVDYKLYAILMRDYKEIIL